MSTKSLLTATAAIELAAGVAFLTEPSFPVGLLLGEALGSAASIVIGRVAGAALVAIAVNCWLEREAKPEGSRGLLAGLLIYNIAVPMLLVHASVVGRMNGVILWPAVVLHLLFALGCARVFEIEASGIKRRGGGG
jgi:hypothetical protein